MPVQMLALLKVHRALASLVVLAVLSLATGPEGAPEPEATAEPEIDPTKEALIRQVIAATGATLHAQENVDRMIATLRHASPETPDRVWRTLREKVDPREIWGVVAALYDRHYSRQEMEDLIDFYRSTAGQGLLQGAS